MAPKLPDSERESSEDGTDRLVVRRRLLSIIIIFLISLSVYSNALLNGFVYDDGMQIVENPWIRDPGYLHHIFSKNAWSFKSQLIVSNYYRPFMHVIYMINYHIFGLQPWGFHLVNMLLHAGNSVLVFIITARLFGWHMAQTSAPSVASNDSPLTLRWDEKGVMSPPFIAALFFAVHPIHTEAVAWIAGLPDLSFSFFFLLSFYLYMRSGGKINGAYLFSVVSFFFAALSKEPALTLPFILAAYDYVFRKREERGISDPLKRYIPFLVVAAISLMMRFHALGGLAPDNRHGDLSVYQYVINVFPLFMQYLGKLLFPVNLNAFHVSHPVSSLLETKGILSLIGTSAFVIASYAAFRKSKAASFSLLLMVVPLLPALYIPGLGVNIFAERYLYLSSAGFVMLPALLVARVRSNSPKWAAGLAVCTVVVLGLYSIGTVNRNAVWKDDYTLWADTVNKSPDAAPAHLNLGQALQLRGQRDEAIEHYRIALGLDPDDPTTHFNLGLAYFFKGWMEMAIGEFRIALLQEPEYPGAGYYLQLAMAAKSHRQ